VQDVLAQITSIPWGHNIAIVSKCKNFKEAIYYVRQTIRNNWSRSVLVHQIESGVYSREGKATTNFSLTLPKPQSDLAIQTLKDPYIFDFLTPTVGILLCKSKEKMVAEYALSDIHKPMGVSEYQLTQSLPENLKGSLPSIEEIERELEKNVRTMIGRIEGLP
jgi:predicted nuclease of restriction endonuclease-like (RecB) superfamily